MPPKEVTADTIKKLALECGYTRCGITDAEPFHHFEAALNRRIERFPETASLYEGMKHRIDPREKAPWTAAIVVGIRSYNDFVIPAGLDRYYGRNYLFDGRLAQCPDSRIPDQMAAGLKELGVRYRKGGVPDRLAAARAGVARIGRNGFAFTAESGSWINIETWRVDAELEPDTPAWETPCPPDCDACMRACPTDAIEAPFVMRMDRCVAYLTYDAPEPIPEDLRRQMGCWVYGCDACQLACPLNEGVWREQRRAPWLEKAAPFLVPEALQNMDSTTLKEQVYPLFWYIPPEKLDRWRRNAQRALANKSTT